MATPAPAASSMTAAARMRILFTFSSLVRFRRVSMALRSDQHATNPEGRTASVRSRFPAPPAGGNETSPRFPLRADGSCSALHLRAEAGWRRRAYRAGMDRMLRLWSAVSWWLIPLAILALGAVDIAQNGSLSSEGSNTTFRGPVAVHAAFL